MSGKDTNDAGEKTNLTNAQPIKDGQIAPKDFGAMFPHKGKQAHAPEAMGKVVASASAAKTNTATSKGHVTKTDSGNVGAGSSTTHNIQRNTSGNKSDTSRKSADASHSNHSNDSKHKHSHKHSKKHSKSISKPQKDNEGSNSKSKVHTNGPVTGEVPSKETKEHRSISKSKAHSNSASKGDDASKQIKQTLADDCPTAIIAPTDYVHIYKGDSNTKTEAKTHQTGGGAHAPGNTNQAKTPAEDCPTALIAPTDYVHIYKGDSKQQNGPGGQGKGS